MPKQFVGNGRNSKTEFPLLRHSRESGNLGMKSSRNLSEITETERSGFPPSREWRRISFRADKSGFLSARE